MKKNAIIIIFLLLNAWLASASAVCATVFADQRDQAVSQTLNCFEQNASFAGQVNWGDVCAMTTSGQTYRDQRGNLIAQELDALDQGFKKQQTQTTQANQLAQNSEPTNRAITSYPVMVVPQADAKEPLALPAEHPSRHRFEAGTEFSIIRYVEDNGFMKESGSMYGGLLSYTYQSTPLKSYNKLFSGEDEASFINMIKWDGKFSLGYVDYESEGGQYKNLPNYMAETRGVIGSAIALNNNALLTPYAGLGYRYLYDALDKFEPGGYAREISYFYAPLGVVLKNQLSASLSLETTFEYDFFIVGRVVSHLEDVDSYLDPLTFRQSKGFGLRGSIRLVKHNGKMDFYAEPFVRYWNIDNSNVQPEIYQGVPTGVPYIEPRNDSTETGLKLGVRF